MKIIFQSAPDAYYLNDLKGTFVDGNKLAEKLTGYKREELIGKNFMKLRLLPPSQIPKAAKALMKNTKGLSTGPDEFKIHRKDGTKVMVETLDDIGINILFCVGGDGTLHGAHAIWEEIERQKKKIAVVGVPKTIDNDISFVYRTFGFDTAVGKAREVLDCAHAEALGAPNGIGLVKVMGRDSGFIAASATLANLENNFLANLTAVNTSLASDIQNLLTSITENITGMNASLESHLATLEGNITGNITNMSLPSLFR